MRTVSENLLVPSTHLPDRHGERFKAPSRDDGGREADGVSVRLPVSAG
jgi:hypothetical protein